MINNSSPLYKSIRITICGVVQGVGFRPFIYNLASKTGISGTVKNTSSGVVIEATGLIENIDSFYDQISLYAPPLSRIDTISKIDIPCNQYPDFRILESESQPGSFSLVPPDIATCPDCLKELFDPANRRYRYPFINCTNCGPRFSIIERMPYDRPFTSMADFPLCRECHDEYMDPSNRRFHAQPIACAVCGPIISLYQNHFVTGIQDDALEKSRKIIQEGGILALKGIGGYQLVCDAFNLDAIMRLRKGKLRSSKPFALMAYDAKTIENFCKINSEDLSLLQSPQHPIVIMPAKNNLLAHNAPGIQTLGFMLPYTPLHYLITEPSSDFPEVLVMTSGNISEEPMLIEEESAFSRLGDIADGFLAHNRPIINRVDDSVYKSCNHYLMPMRRSRGHSPDPVIISEVLPSVFASGALLKNSFTLLIKNQAFISQFIGDLDNLETYKEYESAIQNSFDLFQFSPEIVACDQHPDFLSTTFAKKMAEINGIPLIEVQHHHAHLAACLGENGLPLDKEVIALCYDGTGYGTDGAIWGGEILTGSAVSYKRMGHLEYMPLPGGDLSIKKPYRIAIAYLHSLGLASTKLLPPFEHSSKQELQVIRAQVDKGLNVIKTSSMGRLFDAVSALIGIQQEVSYEGQAAIELEALADPAEKGHYTYSIDNGIILLESIFRSVIEDLEQDNTAGVISARFHNTIAQISCSSIVNIMADMSIDTVVLSGGVWQNSLLLNLTINVLREKGISVKLHSKLPPNDGCISFGQSIIAGINYKRNK